jgi:hypothetical protein
MTQPTGCCARSHWPWPKAWACRRCRSSSAPRWARWPRSSPPSAPRQPADSQPGPIHLRRFFARGCAADGVDCRHHGLDGAVDVVGRAVVAGWVWAVSGRFLPIVGLDAGHLWDVFLIADILYRPGADSVGRVSHPPTAIRAPYATRSCSLMIRHNPRYGRFDMVGFTRPTSSTAALTLRVPAALEASRSLCDEPV